MITKTLAVLDQNASKSNVEAVARAENSKMASVATSTKKAERKCMLAFDYKSLEGSKVTIISSFQPNVAVLTARCNALGVLPHTQRAW